MKKDFADKARNENYTINETYTINKTSISEIITIERHLVSCVDPALSNCFLWLLVIYIYPLYLRRGQPMHFHLISNMPTYFHCIYSPQVVASRNCMAASEGPMVGCCMKSFTRSLYNRLSSCDSCSRSSRTL